jgi:hypothetical protein
VAGPGSVGNCHLARYRRQRSPADRSGQRSRPQRKLRTAGNRVSRKNRRTPQPALRTDIEAARRGLGQPLEDGLRIEAQAFNRSIGASETIEGLRQFNERDHPDRRSDTAPVTPGLARSV